MRLTTKILLRPGGQEEHRIEPPRCDHQEFLAKMERETAKTGVDVPELLKIDDDLRHS